MKPTTIQTVLANEYEVGVAEAPWYAVMWAAEKVERKYGPQVAARQLRAVNSVRQRHGAYTDIPAYGTPLFAAYRS